MLLTETYIFYLPFDVNKTNDIPQEILNDVAPLISSKQFLREILKKSTLKRV